MAFPSPERIRHAVGVVGAEIDRQLSTDARQPWTESWLWTELACCMLSSQVPYEMAQAAAVRLDTSGLFLTEGVAQRDMEIALAELLRCPFDIGGVSRQYRFPDSRARQLAATVVEVRREANGLFNLLRSFDDIEIARGWFVSNAKGLGPKQASMFLRNVGASYDLAVLDRHLINYMMMMGLTNDPKPMRRMADYRRDEIVLRDHAASFGLQVGLLDWAVWIVMRVANSKVIEDQVE